MRLDSFVPVVPNTKELWCWIFNNLAIFAVRPDQLGPSFDDIIKDAGTRRLSTEEKAKIARNMLADGVLPEKVAQYTGLTVEEVDALNSSQN